MKVLELMCSLEEAYDRFGDIDVNVYFPMDISFDNKGILVVAEIKELVIESEEFIIKCEQ
jgi:hypothetical protein